MALLSSMLIPSVTYAQTGVDDDRVSLPEGPGSLEGVGDNVEIDPNMGSMSYSVPVRVPAGRGAMQPQVGLSYSSSAGVGVVGVGWSMPMPAITRMTSRGVPGYDREDYFTFDGSDELVQTGERGQDLVYRSRFEKAFRRHTWVAPGEGSAGYWKVEFPDGSIGYYGADRDGTSTPDAQLLGDDGQIAEYKLVEMVDPFGNRVRYDYEKFDGKVPLLSRISYVFVDEQPLYQIEYAYASRQDVISDANYGFETQLSHRLEGIRIWAATQIVDEYLLTYESEMASGGISRLAGVRHFGRGGIESGPEDEIRFSFDYQRGLGVDCQETDCNKPYLVEMGSVGVSLGSGSATLIDINGDGLPDVLDSSQPGSNHRFILNELVANEDDTFTHRFGEVLTSKIDQSTSFPLSETVKTLDVNGDGYSDLINTTTGSFLLKDPDADDWLVPGTSMDPAGLLGVDFNQARFFDYDNDKKIDVLISTGTATQIVENDGQAFSMLTTGIENIGVGFEGGTLQMADINGDGMSEPVELLTSSGLFRYHLNLGNGVFADPVTMTGESVPTSERDVVDLEDLNGDGRDDVVIVNPNQIKYAINRGDGFDDFVTIDSSDTLTLPQRGDGVSVLYADMNANGSEDIVWFMPDGNVTYLELFPERPNLMSVADNGIGFVQRVTYSTAAQEAARSKRDGAEWTYPLQIPMAVVKRNDNYVRLTGNDDGSGLHDVITYAYRDGFYDGVEKQYRGFSHVMTMLEENDSQQAGRTEMIYDLGREDVYFNGLKLSERTFSQERELLETLDEYERCELDASVPSEATLENQGKFPVVHVCQSASTQVVKEGLQDESRWKTTKSEYTYDAYGRVTKAEALGLLDVDGDEMVSETTYYEPGEKWFLDLRLREQSYVDPAGDRTDKRYYYDGEDFIGSQTEITRGFLSRVTEDTGLGEVLNVSRQRPDAYGQVIESLDPLGSPENTTSHRTSYEIDEYGLFVLSTTRYNEDADGNPYTLVRRSGYDLGYQNVTRLSDWIVIQNGEAKSPENITEIAYDGLNREVARALPGDSLQMPTAEATYDLGETFTTVRIESRSQPGGPLDRETVRCLDGRGREYQTRTRIDAGEYLVTGFVLYNSRGAVVESFQPYHSDSSECDESPPAGVRSSKMVYDASFRPVSETQPDAEIYGEDSIKRYEYEPFEEIAYDFEDALEGGTHEGTPIYRRMDGQGRVIEILRSWKQDGTLQTASYKLYYDNTGSFTGYEDPEGNRHELTVDSANRVVKLENPNFGTVDITYDAAGNVLTRTDSRGVTTTSRYDGLNRLVERHDDADAQSSRVSWSFDLAPNCDVTECTQLAGRLASIDYQLEGQTPGEQRFGYDARGRMIFEGRRFGDLDLANTMSYSNVSELSEITYPDGSTFSMERDDVDRVTRIPGYIDAVDYEQSGLLMGLDYANGVKTRYTYDALRRTESLSHTDATGLKMEAFEFTRDRLGNLLEVVDVSGREDVPDASLTLGYDDWYRLRDVVTFHAGGEQEQLSYIYDVLDNIAQIDSSLQEKSPVHVGAMSYDEARPNQVKQAGELSFDYDAYGQMTRRGDTEFAWDHLGRMSQAGEQRYLYGPDQMQLGTLGESELVLYGPGDFEVRDGVSVSYVRLNKMRVARRQSTSLMAQIYPDMVPDGQINAGDAWLLTQGEPDVTPGFAPAATPARVLGAAAARMLAESEDEKVFLHPDYLGSLTIATDEGGEVSGQRAYYPTGKVRWSQGEVDVYGFTGEEHMDSGLLRFQFRHLDTTTARWTSFDPAFMTLSVAQMERLGEATTGYAYVSNNFSNFVDPLGLGESRFQKLKKKFGKKKEVRIKVEPSKNKKFVQPLARNMPAGWVPKPPPGAPPYAKQNQNRNNPVRANQNARPNVPQNQNQAKGGGSQVEKYTPDIRDLPLRFATRSSLERMKRQTDAKMKKWAETFKKDVPVLATEHKIMIGSGLLIIGGAVAGLVDALNSEE